MHSELLVLCLMVKMYCTDLYLFFFFFQARDVRTNEVVAIKKMSYSGKQSNEVRQDEFYYYYYCLT